MFKIILIIPKRDYDLKILFIPKGMNYRMGYALKTILNSEGTINRKWTIYGLKNTLNSEGAEGVAKGEKDSST